MRKLVFGQGFYEKGKYVAIEKVDGVRRKTKEYRLWQGIMERCYSHKCHMREPTYVGCQASDNFKNFQYFAEWCQNQIGFNNEGYHLDKDILGTGKLYSEDYCVFVPARVNTLLLKPKITAKDLPLGVYFCKRQGKYKSQVNSASVLSHQKGLGYFDTQEEAFLAYKFEKERIIKCVAAQYLGMVDSRVYEALCNYQINEY